MSAGGSLTLYHPPLSGLAPEHRMWIIALILTGLGAFTVAFILWKRKIDAENKEGADYEWRFLEKNEPEFLEGLSRAHFDEIYARVHTPRFPGYALAAAWTFVLWLPVTFAALTGGLWVAQALGVAPQPADVADRLILEDGEIRYFSEAPPEAALYYIEDLAGFYFFFGVIFVWLLIVAFYMRRFHARRPGYLRDEIIRSRS